jgi:hypothetical protein
MVGRWGVGLASFPFRFRSQSANTITTYRAVRTARAPKRPMPIPKSKLRLRFISPSPSARALKDSHNIFENSGSSHPDHNSETKHRDHQAGHKPCKPAPCFSTTPHFFALNLSSASRRRRRSRSRMDRRWRRRLAAMIRPRKLTFFAVITSPSPSARPIPVLLICPVCSRDILRLGSSFSSLPR